MNIIKTPIKFDFLKDKSILLSKLYFKYTGSNIFITLINNENKIFFRCSSGFFKGVNTKQKKNVVVAKNLGQLVLLRLYKSNVRQLLFITFLTKYRCRFLLKSFFFGMGFLRYNLKNFRIISMKIKQKIVRNGIRLKAKRTKRIF